MIFDRQGNLLRAGADQVINGKKIDPNGVRSGAVDRQGNVSIIEREHHRIVKLNPTLDKFLMQLGVTDQPGTDATHLNLPSGMAILKSGNIVVTDGYGNNRVVLYDPHGKFIKQIGKGAGGPVKGTGHGDRGSAAQARGRRGRESLCLRRDQWPHPGARQEPELPAHPAEHGMGALGFAIARRGNTGYGFVADREHERVVKISLSDGRILAAWGKAGRGPGEFDWIHAVVEDFQGRGIRRRYLRPASAEIPTGSMRR